MSFIRQITFDPSNMSAFGTLEADKLDSVFQSDFVYGLNTQMWNAPVINGADAAVTPTAAAMGTPESGGRLKIESGTVIGNYAYITSRKILRYRAGQGNVIRFTPLFTVGTANNLQLWGVGSIVSNAPYDGYFFGYNGAAFSIFHYVRGSAASGYPVAQGSWNGDKVDGSAGSSFTWNKTFGVPCMIKYPYLGYGDIEFFVQNPTSGRWVLVHTIRYANTTAATQLLNPSMQVIGFTSNSALTAASMTMYMGSVGCFVSGERSFIGNPKWGVDAFKSNAYTLEQAILSIRNATTYNTITNKGVIRMHSISVAAVSSGTAKDIVIRLRIGATLAGSPAYAAISGTTGDSGVTITAGNSIASYDVAATTATAGNLIYNVAAATNGGTSSIDLTPYDLYLAPTEIFTASGFTGSAGSIDVAVTLNWSEDI